jgi:hypothetical protein
MSKRFGRNQRRALREEVNKYVTAHEIDRALLGRQRQQIETLTAAMRTVAGELGERFFGLPPVRRAVDRVFDIYRLPKPIATETLMFIDGDELCSLVEHAVYNLSMVTASVERDRITGRVHIMLDTPDGKRFYAVSASAWESLRRDKNRMAQQFLPMVAAEMANFIARGER